MEYKTNLITRNYSFLYNIRDFVEKQALKQISRKCNE